MISAEPKAKDLSELLADWQLEDQAWSLSIKLMRMPHDEFASYVQSITEEYTAS